MSIIPAVIDAHAMLGRESYLALDPDELLRCMDAVGVTATVEGVGESLGGFPALIEETDRKQSRIAGELALQWLDYQQRAEEG